MNKLIEALVVAVPVIILAAIAVFLFFRFRKPKQLKVDYFQSEWKALQGKLRDKTKWSESVIAADDLLSKALKKKHLGGHNTGERLVKAQRLFTDNDSVWFGHKLRNKIDDKPKTKLKEAEVKQALVGIRQALIDVGALPDVKPRTKK